MGAEYPARPGAVAMPGSPSEIKNCCAAAYGSDAVALLLGEAYHPGGLALTRRLAGQVAAAGARVLDVAAGRGATTLLLAREFGARVDGVDLSETNVAAARETAAGAGLADQVTFTVGDAESLPYPGAVFDVVVCECAFCTFPDKPTAAAELARVLRPGGRVGITDVVADPDRLPPELTSLAAWVACIADARPLPEYRRLLTGAGLTVTRAEAHDEAMTRMIDQIEARLRLLRMTGLDRAAQAGIDLDRAPAVLAAARRAVTDGVLGYALIVAGRPA